LSCGFLALNKNRRFKSQPDAISAFDAKVKPLNYLLLFFIPLVAIGIYFLALAADARLHTNKVIYYASSTLGALLWVVSVVVMFRENRATNETIAMPNDPIKPTEPSRHLSSGSTTTH